MKLSVIQKNIKRGSSTWYLREQCKEGVRLRSLHTDSRIEAERILAKETAAKLGNTYVTAPGVQEANDRFLDYVEIQHGRQKTYTNYSSMLKPLISFFRTKRIKTVADFNNVLANEFICNFKDLKKSTVRQRVKTLRLFFKWIIKTWDLKNENPFKEIQLPNLKSKEKSFWKPDQVQAILDATERPDLRLLFALMGYAGLRFFEAEKVAWSDIQGGFLKVWGKGEKFAKIPISNKLNGEILRYRKTAVPGGSRLFQRITNTEANRAIKKACTLSRIDFEGAANCHRLRHSFASNLIGAGASIVSVQRLLRHSSAAITLGVYSHILKEDLNKDVELI